MYICIYIYVHVYIYIYIHMCVSIHIMYNTLNMHRHATLTSIGLISVHSCDRMSCAANR